MKKRGQLVYKSIITLVMAGMIILSFISAGKAFGSGDAYYKRAAASDLALLIEQLQATSGEATVSYNRDLSDHTVRVSGTEVTIFSAADGRLDPTQASATFVGPRISDQQVIRPDPLIIEKKDNQILLRTDGLG